jgi:hypothetical protein
MPEQVPLPTEDPQAVDELAATGGPSLLAKIKILLFVTVVIAAECVLAWLYLPSASQTEAMAEAATESEVRAEAAAEKEAREPVDESAGWVEVDLGEFSGIVCDPVGMTMLRVDFHLWGMVDEADCDEFLRLFDEHNNRFREQLRFAVSSAEITDLTDPNLGLLKRTILERTNKILGKPLLRVVLFPDFSLYEQ